MVFWLVAFIISRYDKFNSTFFIGLVGLIFYSFQGFFNSSVLLYVFLITCIFNRLKKSLSLFIILTILPLLIIKYSNFILKDLLKINFNSLFLENIIIPPGLSFISFSAIALLIYIKKNSENIKTNLAYLYLFPQLIAGPIVEPKSLIPQLKKNELASFENIFLGIFIFSVGISIKVLLADSIANYVDPIFNNLQNYEFKIRLSALFLFSQQIFFDFNGYTLMAIGVGKTIGINLPENFNAPYLSKSISDFWKRWHITLSNWIKNYIYIPLGGSREGKLKNYTNIFIAMLISGIWHGAGYSFIIWGFMHALFIFFEKIIDIKYFDKKFDFIKVIYSYFIVTSLWLFFRVNETNDIKIFFSNFSYHELLDVSILFFVLFIFIINYLQKYITLKSLNFFYKKINRIVITSMSFAMIIICIILAKGSSQKFIYFNF